MNKERYKVLKVFKSQGIVELKRLRDGEIFLFTWDPKYKEGRVISLNIEHK